MVGVLVSDGMLFGIAAWAPMPAFVGASRRFNLALMRGVRSAIPMLAPVDVSTVAAAVLTFPMIFAPVAIASLIISADVATGVAISGSLIRVIMSPVTAVGCGSALTAVMSVHIVVTRHVHVARTGAHRIHIAPLVTAFGGLGPLLATGEPGDGPADDRGRFFRGLGQDADARAGQLCPHLIDGGGEIVIGLTGNDQQVRISGTDCRDNAGPGQLDLHGQPSRGGSGSDRQQSMRSPCRQPGQPLVYDHRSAPSRHA
jgi:hypothetical protein